MGIVISTTGPPLAFILWGYINLYQPHQQKLLQELVVLMGISTMINLFYQQKLDLFCHLRLAMCNLTVPSGKLT